MRFDVDSAVTIINFCVIAGQDQELRAQPIIEELMSLASGPSVLAGLVSILYNYCVIFVKNSENMSK
jgi:hypothetical protein